MLALWVVCYVIEMLTVFKGRESLNIQTGQIQPERYIGDTKDVHTGKDLIFLWRCV